jgi:hypothetical protein
MAGISGPVINDGELNLADADVAHAISADDPRADNGCLEGSPGSLAARNALADHGW